MFLLRCFFWLSVVFTSMSWTSDASGPRGWREALHGEVLHGEILHGEGAVVATVARTVAVEGATSWCAASPGRCLADASRLTALVVATDRDGEIEVVSPRELVRVAPAEALPLPPFDPRRHLAPRG